VCATESSAPGRRSLGGMNGPHLVPSADRSQRAQIRADAIKCSEPLALWSNQKQRAAGQLGEKRSMLEEREGRAGKRDIGAIGAVCGSSYGLSPCASRRWCLASAPPPRCRTRARPCTAARTGRHQGHRSGQMKQTGGDGEAAPPVLCFQLRVRVEIIGPQTCGIVGRSQPVLMMSNPMIFTRTCVVFQ
jgi:hypothetical protein